MCLELQAQDPSCEPDWDIHEAKRVGVLTVSEPKFVPVFVHSPERHQGG